MNRSATTVHFGDITIGDVALFAVGFGECVGKGFAG